VVKWLALWALCVLHVLPRYSSFLQQSKDIQAWLTGDTQCECEWLSVSMCQPCDSLVTCPVLIGIGLSPFHDPGYRGTPIRSSYRNFCKALVVEGLWLMQKCEWPYQESFRPFWATVETWWCNIAIRSL